MHRPLLWTLCAFGFILTGPVLAHAGGHDGPCNQLGRFFGLGWSDGYHAHNLCCGCCDVYPTAAGALPCCGYQPAASADSPLPAPMSPTPAFDPPIPAAPVGPPTLDEPTPAAPPGPPAPDQPTLAPPMTAMVPQGTTQGWWLPAQPTWYSPMQGVYLPRVSYAHPSGPPWPAANVPTGTPTFRPTYGPPYGGYPPYVPVTPVNYPRGW